MHYVYTLYSLQLDRFYIGETFDVLDRLRRHNEDHYAAKWTKDGQPWDLYLTIVCEDKRQALAIERHIERIKSRKYIENLGKYPGIIDKLQIEHPPLPDC